MYLDEIFKKAPHLEINQISCDSRIQMKNCMFFCIQGIKYDGHNFIEEAIKNGATVIIYDQNINKSLNAIYIKVNDCLDVLNKIAPYFYGNPAKDMINYIISGCYNKANTSNILINLLSNFKKTGSITTKGIIYDNISLQNAARTLPVIENQSNLRKMKEKGIEACVFESSVQDLSYYKLDAVNPKYFIYTYTSIESTEYKELNRTYCEELLKYIDRLDKNTILVLNSDDSYFDEIVREFNGKYITYGRANNDDVIIKGYKYFVNKSKVTIEFKNKEYSYETLLLGPSGVYASVAAIAALSSDYSMDDILKLIPTVKGIKGIYERIDIGQLYNVYVDEAENIDTIESILMFASKITNGLKKIVTIISFNYLATDQKIDDIVKLIVKYSKIVIYTVGDTYTNDVSSLLKKAKNASLDIKTIIIDDREVAIEEGIELLNEGDTLLILSKGDSRILNLSLGKVPYQGDNTLARKFIEKRMKEENDLNNY